MAALPDYRAVAATLLGKHALVFPVRHHSPGCALQLLRLLQSQKPAEILIEGPSDFAPLLPWLAHEQARPPLAIYAYEIAADGARRAAYYPFAECSPEWVALRYGAQHDIPVRFVDLPFAAMAGHDRAENSLQDEHQLRHSARLTALASQLGCRDHEELWEHLFEIPAPCLATEEHVARVLAYCELARQDYSDAQLHADGTLRREACMALALQQAVARQAGTAPVLLVLGGFHALSVATAAMANGKVEAPAIEARELVEQGAALIPFSDQRLDRLNGYAAGMSAPHWQRSIYQAFAGKALPSPKQSRQLRAQLALAVLAGLAESVRVRQSLPMPTLKAAFEQALRLAQLRQRQGIARDDLRDAALSTLVEGAADFDGTYVLRELDTMLMGDRMGQVPHGVSTPPLVRDFTTRAARCRLKLDGGQARRTQLQIYTRPAHRACSRLLHACLFLGIPFALKLGGPDLARGAALSRLHERWQYHYTPATAAALVEASVHGSSIEQALAQVFTTRLDAALQGSDARSAPAAVRWLAQAYVLGLIALLPKIEALLRHAIAADAEFPSLVRAVVDLHRLALAEPLQGNAWAGLSELLGATWQRAMYLGQLFVGGTPEAWVEALIELRSVSELPQSVMNLALFDATVERIALAHPSALVRGAASGVLYTRNRIALDALEQHVRGHLGGILPVAEAVAFLRGLLGSARELAWQQSALLDALNSLWQTWSDEEFIRLLPELRLAFSALTPHETDRVAAAVATMIGAPLVLNGQDLDAAATQALLQAELSSFRLFEADGLAHWWPQ